MILPSDTYVSFFVEVQHAAIDDIMPNIYWFQ
jgi:hypothetical protein